MSVVIEVVVGEGGDGGRYEGSGHGGGGDFSDCGAEDW